MNLDAIQVLITICLMVIRYHDVYAEPPFQQGSEFDWSVAPPCNSSLQQIKSLKNVYVLFGEKSEN